MKVVIEVPSEFKPDVEDKFQDFFGRIIADMNYNGVCGLYEEETAWMLKRAFNNMEEIENA